MSKQIKIVPYITCLNCKDEKCKQEDEQMQICFFYNRKYMKNIDEIFDEECTDIIKYYILWFLDDVDCKLALTKSKELSQAVEKIIAEVKQKLGIDK